MRSPEGADDTARRWLAALSDLTAEDAARSRSRRRQLLDQSAQDATFVGSLQALAERRGRVAITDRTGRDVRGLVLAVGADFVALRVGERLVFAVLDAIATVQPGTPLRLGAVDAPPPRARLAWVLADLAGCDVVLVVAGRTIAGVVVDAAADVLTLRQGEPGTAPLVVPYDSLSAVSMPLSSVTADG